VPIKKYSGLREAIQGGPNVGKRRSVQCSRDRVRVSLKPIERKKNYQGPRASGKKGVVVLTLSGEEGGEIFHKNRDLRSEGGGARCFNGPNKEYPINEKCTKGGVRDPSEFFAL